MPLTGDWARLQATIRGLRALAKIPSTMAAPAARAIKAEIDRSFASNSSPYGHKWAAHASSTVRRWGKHPLLRLTGEGFAGIRVVPLPGAGIQVISESEGLAFAQAGTVNEPRRPFLPDDVMPATWNRALERVATEQIKGALANAG